MNILASEGFTRLVKVKGFGSSDFRYLIFIFDFFTESWARALYLNLVSVDYRSYLSRLLPTRSPSVSGTAWRGQDFGSSLNKQTEFFEQKSTKYL